MRRGEGEVRWGEVSFQLHCLFLRWKKVLYFSEMDLTYTQVQRSASHKLFSEARLEYRDLMDISWSRQGTV